MIVKTVGEMFVDLGVTKSHSRPSMSSDNPFSESAFKTLKYRPDFPVRFPSLKEARQYCKQFFTWYNHASSFRDRHAQRSVSQRVATVPHFLSALLQAHRQAMQQGRIIKLHHYSKMPCDRLLDHAGIYSSETTCRDGVFANMNCEATCRFHIFFQSVVHSMKPYSVLVDILLERRNIFVIIKVKYRDTASKNTSTLLFPVRPYHNDIHHDVLSPRHHQPEF